MPTPPPPEPDDDLVAYLDGELADDAAQTVESKLAADPATRARAEALRKTFDLLDALPKPDPSPTFATRTLTRLDPVPTTAFVATPSRSWRPVAAWAAAVLVAGGLGYVAHLLARPLLTPTPTAKRASEEVRLLERLPLYLGVDDLDFVKQLDDPDLFAAPSGEPPRPPADATAAAELAALEDLFKTFPPARQEQLRKLDDDLFALDPPARDRLSAVVERYAVWLDRLPDSYRREVLSAPAAADRLEAVRRVRARLWREALPAPVRAKLADADAAEKDALLAEWRQREQDRRRKWDALLPQLATAGSARPWPFDTETGSKQMDEYYTQVLRPRLRPPEAATLDAIRTGLVPAAGWGDWWDYATQLHRAAAVLEDRQPHLGDLLPGRPQVMSLGDLQAHDPQAYKRITPPVRKRLADVSGRWPEFARKVLEEAKDSTLVKPLGPSRPNELADPAGRFVSELLLPALTRDERDELVRAETRWPDYPRKVVDLARKHDLSVPGVMLPGAPSKWVGTYGPPRPAAKK